MERAQQQEGIVFTLVTLMLGILHTAVTVEAQYSNYEVQSFLDPQNEARAQVGLPPLVWNNNLAAFAHNWAMERLEYGDCRLEHSGGPYGENIFWGIGKDWQPWEAVQEWVNERNWYDYYTNTCLYYDACGHYTQIVWRQTTQVGCSRQECPDGNIFMTCNYYPRGNWIGQRPY